MALEGIEPDSNPGPSINWRGHPNVRQADCKEPAVNCGFYKEMYKHNRIPAPSRSSPLVLALPLWLQFLSRSGTTKLAPFPLVLCQGRTDHSTVVLCSQKRSCSRPEPQQEGPYPARTWGRRKAAHQMLPVRAKCVLTIPLLISGFLSPNSSYVSSGLMLLLIKLKEKILLRRVQRNHTLIVRGYYIRLSLYETRNSSFPSLGLASDFFYPRSSYPIDIQACLFTPPSKAPPQSSSKDLQSKALRSSGLSSIHLSAEEPGSAESEGAGDQGSRPSARAPGHNEHSCYSIRCEVIPNFWYPTTRAAKNPRKSSSQSFPPMYS